MDRDVALRTLGVDVTTAPDEVRRRYLALIRQHHPDVASEPTEVDAALITEAYRVVVSSTRGDAIDDGGDDPAQASATRAPVEVAAAGDTIVVELPPDEAFFALLDVAADVGVVTYVDPEAGLLEIQLALTDGSRCSMVCSMQGRAIGTTDVFCTVASLGGPEGHRAPPLDVLVGELAAVLAGSLNC